jgi:hypothetical protein
MNYAQNKTSGQSSVQENLHHVGDTLRERVEGVRDVIDNVRDRAEVAFRDRPYLVPVAAGALGLGIGLLLGSKLTRFIVFTAVGTLITDTFGGQIKRLSRDFVGQMQNRLNEGEGRGERGMSGLDEGEGQTT